MAMTQHHRKILRSARVFLLENLDIDLIIPHLVSELLLSAADEDGLAAKQTKRDKIKYLLDLLPRKGDKGYSALMKVLEEHQTFVFEELWRMESGNASSSNPQQSGKFNRTFFEGFFKLFVVKLIKCIF